MTTNQITQGIKEYHTFDIKKKKGKHKINFTCMKMVNEKYGQEKLFIPRHHGYYDTTQTFCGHMMTRICHTQKIIYIEYLL